VNSPVHFVKTCFFVFCLIKNISALLYSKQAAKDSKKIELSNLKPTVKHLIEIIKNNPFENPPPYAKLVGDLAGKYSRRVNIRLRLVYEIFGKEHIDRILRMWTCYE